MSLSGALSNAMSGLAANARGTSVISANIANALNEGFGRREVVLSTDANQSSGGVRVAQVTRYSDPILSHQKRLASAEFGYASTIAGFASNVEQLWGSVDTPDSVANQMTKFETALVAAASDPSSDTRLRNVSYAAESFANSLRSASNGIQQARTDAEKHIAASVDEMNGRLSKIEKLNHNIMTAKHVGQDVLALVDQREMELDRLSEFVPLHVVERESGEVAVFTRQGRTLIDTRAVEITFDGKPAVLSHMSVSNGLLSGLRVDGQNIDVSMDGPLSGGRLAATFELRDSAAPAVQARIDAIARDLIDRFGAGGPDSTINIGDPGVFTDAGGPFSPADETGLAGRIELNSTLATSGSDLWRWRDGLYAPSRGDVGTSGLIMDLRAQVSQSLVPGSLELGATPNSLSGHVLGLSSKIAADRVRTSDLSEFASVQLDQFRQAAAAEGVNTDQELQKLIELEKSYAANARVVQVVDDMLAELLRI
ncbi:flagellar hook-associated protein FlgK [Marivita sp. S2033]|uniref:flagellar hook-associated protein FlgK n=1 Tax=Marivita sp. S2033 TaxID=3373187 RepID=UPI003981AB0A